MNKPVKPVEPIHPFDPRLRMMMDEFLPIFLKYQVFGFVALEGVSHAEFRYFFPERSLAKFVGEKIIVSLDKEKHSEEDLKFTVTSLIGLKRMGLMVARTMGIIEQALRKKFEIQIHTTPPTPHGKSN